MEMRNYKQFKNTLLQNREIRKTYKELEPEFSLIRAIIKKRIEKGLTQKELAQKIGTKQSAISRLESGSYNPTIFLLKKVSEALGAEVSITIK